jgi:TalC/MipB family fructose-6-phosphate aldolase
MELYLDSADVNEIKKAFQLGFLNGLTTTPTFMHRHGITDIDGTIIELSKIVPVLQIEALGSTAEEIVAEAERQHKLGLDKSRTVFKIPISMEGVKACKTLKDKGFLVNIHLVYTLQQAYLAMSAGADYVCPLVGRLQDQGQDALWLVEQCVQAVNHYGYNTRIMFSSVRHVEHVRNALNLGVHTVTIPWKVLKQLSENHFTELGTKEFFEHTRLMTKTVRDVISDVNPVVTVKETIHDCLVKMTLGGDGAVTIINSKGAPIGIFTDGDLRRMIEKEGGDSVNKKAGDLSLKVPQSVEASALLYVAAAKFKETQVDTLVVTENGKAVGMIDVQDLLGINGY